MEKEDTGKKFIRMSLQDRVKLGEKELAKVGRLLEKLAARGHLEANFQLGEFYSSGEGVREDKRKAFDFYETAAGKGHAKACFKLALCYQQAEGVEQNNKKALQWFERAAERGDKEAAEKLGNFFYSGELVEKDLEKAARYFFACPTRRRRYKFRFVEENHTQFTLLVTKKLVNWRSEYHKYFFRGGIKHVNPKIVTLLLVSNERKNSNFTQVYCFNKGITMNVIKFLCNLSQQ